MKKLTKLLLAFVIGITMSFNVVAQTATQPTGGKTVSNWTGPGSAPVIYEDNYVSSTVPYVVPKYLQERSSNRSRSATVLTKFPDRGAYWQVLSSTGSYVYSNSFISLGDGYPTELGTWLRLYSGSNQNIRFEIWGDNGGIPDPMNIFATTGSISPLVSTSLDFYSAPVLSGASNLVNGVKYWYVATCVGEPSSGATFQVGGHTQNSVYNDNGTFRYSNDPAGIVFNSPHTPEMAFEVTIDDNPPAPSVPVSDWAIYLGIFLIAAFMVVRYRRVNIA